MRAIISILSLLLFFCFACKKEEKKTCPDDLEAARIIGQDFRLCPCCGGWWIEIETDTLLAFTLPDNIEVDDFIVTDSTAIPVCLTYEKMEDCGSVQELIKITEIVLQ